MDVKLTKCTTLSTSYTSINKTDSADPTDPSEDPEAQMIDSKEAKKTFTLRTNLIILICVLAAISGLGIALLIHFHCQPWTSEEPPLMLDIKNNQTDATTELIQVGK